MTDRPLDGLKVLDAATVFAGPAIATLMGDFGADVIKVEHPRGDALRSFGWSKQGTSLWWTVLARNKRCITLDLSQRVGAKLFLRLAQDADVFIENFRPGTLERWGLGPEILHEVNPGLVVVRTTGFGQSGPYRDRAGFGTLAEAMSGYAYVNGWPEKPPALPPLALADAVAALTGCYAAMFALWWREHGGEGRGQVIDLAIYESLFAILGPQATIYDQLGIVQERTGNRIPFGAPRNAYQAKDGTWLALSAVAQSIAERVMRIVGRPDVIDEPWFADNSGRVAHVDELDAIIGGWIGERTTDEVLTAFEGAQAAIAPIYSIADIMSDPQYLARSAVTTISDRVLGPVAMQNVTPKMSRTPGRIAHAGPAIGEHNDEVYIGQLGLDGQQLERLRESGVL